MGTLNAVTLNAVTLLVRLGADVNDYAALGIFFRFQVTDFDAFLYFFSLCHFIFPIYLFGLFVRCVNESLSLTVNPAERGSGGVPGETPNGLSASSTLSVSDRECQYYSSELPIPVPRAPFT